MLPMCQLKVKVTVKGQIFNKQILHIMSCLLYNSFTNLGYNPLVFDGVMAFYKNMAHLAGASVSYGHIFLNVMKSQRFWVSIERSLNNKKFLLLVVGTKPLIKRT